jgi:hypothetical protein
MSQRLKWYQHIAHTCLPSAADIQTVWSFTSTLPKKFCGKAFHAVGKLHPNFYMPLHVHTMLLTKLMFTAGWVIPEDKENLNCLLQLPLFLCYAVATKNN